MKSKYLAVLGASDPEMEAIETLLRECGVTVVYATVGGTRVHPGNAYRADVPPELFERWDGIIAVECDRRGMSLDVVRVDHHRHGDYGYGLPPSEFLRASSLGQVIMWLASRWLLPPSWDNAFASECETRRRGSLEFRGGAWYVISLEERECRDGSGEWVRIPRDLVLTAAADHCLGAAYRGECPGVDPDELLAHRVANRARYQHRADSERGEAKGDVTHYESLIRERIEAARQALREAPHITLDPGVDADHSPVIEVRDVRRDTPIDELLEAATRDDVAYIAGPFIQPDGRRKFTCSGNREHIEAFMKYWGPANGLTDIYGDPARGFAGGYEA